MINISIRFVALRTATEMYCIFIVPLINLLIPEPLTEYRHSVVYLFYNMNATLYSYPEHILQQLQSPLTMENWPAAII